MTPKHGETPGPHDEASEGDELFGSASEVDVEGIEVAALIESVYRRYGLDFRGYSPSSLRRRIRKHLTEQGYSSVSAMQEAVLRQKKAMARLLQDMTVHATSMFRDPSFFLAFREKVVPRLRTYPFLRIWHAGIATGEELYSMAILLREEGLYERVRLYGTDMSERMLQAARNGIFPLDRAEDYERNYQLAGGKAKLSDYYTAAYDAVRLDRALLNNAVLSQHNLVTDGSFAEVHVVLCRNVLIYFGARLQERVLGLFHDSLVPFGYLGLGRRETLRQPDTDLRFEGVDEVQRLYRRVA